MKNKAPYTVTTPCSNCPFRTDVAPYLRPERAMEISQSLNRGEDFTCHKTLETDCEGDTVIGNRSRTCAGSMILLEKMDRPTQGMRIGERLGMYSRENLDMDAPVYDSLFEWVDSFAPETDSSAAPHCDVVGPHCTDPAGYMDGNGVTANMAPGHSENECPACGKNVCDECMAPEPDEDGNMVCLYCFE